MKNLKLYQINLLGLANKVHEFDFELPKDFFTTFANSLFEWAQAKVVLTLDKKESLIVADFDLQGDLGLICDRSLKDFVYPFESKQRIYFKYAPQYEEVNEEIIHIPFGAEKLELAQLFYEFVALEVPVKKLHPDFVEQQQDDDEEIILVYSTESEEQDSESENQDTNKTWDVLKNLKK